MNTRATRTVAAPSSVRKAQLGPSRVDNARQQRIAHLIDGYESTITLSAVTRSVLLVWLVPAAGMIFLGVRAYGVRSDPTAQGFALSDEFSSRLLSAIHFSSALLLVVTGAVLLMWTMRSWLNLARIGPKPAISIWPKLRLHLPGFAFGMVGLLSRPVLGSDSRISGALLVVGLVGGLAIAPILLIDTYRAIWQRSTSPKSGSEELPASSVILIFSLAVAVTIVVLNKILGGGVISMSYDGAWFLTTLQGLAIISASWTAASLLTEIARRQDLRLVYIVESSAEEAAQSGIVTDAQIDSEWAESEGMIEFDQ